MTKYIRAALSVLALTVLFAKNVATQTAAANLTAGKLVNILSSEGGDPTIQSQPNPFDKPNFKYSFNVQFTSSCDAYQQATVLKTMQNAAGLADRLKLWETDSFHSWQGEVDYWFTKDSVKYASYIKSQAP